MFSIQRCLPLIKRVVRHGQLVNFPALLSKSMFSSVPSNEKTVDFIFPIQSIESMADVADSLDLISSQEGLNYFDHSKEVSKVLSFIGNDQQKINILTKEINCSKPSIMLSQLINLYQKSISSELKESFTNFFVSNNIHIPLINEDLDFEVSSVTDGVSTVIGRNYLSQYIVDIFTNLSNVLLSRDTRLTVSDLQAIYRFSWYDVSLNDGLDKNEMKTTLSKQIMLPVQQNLINYLQKYKLEPTVRVKACETLEFLMWKTRFTCTSDYIQLCNDILKMNITVDDKVTLLNQKYFKINAKFDQKIELFDCIAKQMEIFRLQCQEYTICYARHPFDDLIRRVLDLCEKRENIIFMGRSKAFINELLNISEERRQNMLKDSNDNRRCILKHLLENENNKNMMLKLCENQPEMKELLTVCEKY